MTPNRPLRAAAVALLVLATGSVHAGTGNLYSVTTRMEMPGMPFQMPPRSVEVCGPKNAASEKMVPADENCRVEDFRVVGNRSTFRMVCTGENAMTATGEFEQLANDGYRGRMQSKMQMEGQSMDMTMTFEGRKIRECDYATESPEAKGREMMAQSCGQMLSAPGNPYMLWESFAAPGAMCASDKAKFCARVTPIAGDPAALRAAESTDAQVRGTGSPGHLWQALQACGLPRATVLTKACARAEALPDYEFIGELCPAAIARACTKADAAKAPDFVARHCPVLAEQTAKKHCVSRGFTADLGNAYSRFCTAWSAQRLRDGRQDGGAEPAAPTPPPAEEEPKKKSWLDRARDVLGG